MQGELLEPGVRVEVRRRFDARWAPGFEVADATETGYRIRRLSDGSILPVEFDPEEIRRERRRDDWWWY